MNLKDVIATRDTKTVYRDGNKKVKLFIEGYSKADVLNEALNQARVEETGLAIPKLHEVTKIDGRWAIVTDYIEGQTLQQLMDSDAANRDTHLAQLVDIQTHIHTFKSPLLTKLKDKMHRKISQTTLDATTRYDLHTRLDSLPKHDKVCHGDFNAENVVIAKDGTPYVIDWAHATQGNASADAARTYLYLNLQGKKDEAEQYLQLFCAKTDTARQYVQLWLPIVAASQSVKGRPEERDLLLRWVAVVDYQ